jgi:hypothetical protein
MTLKVIGFPGWVSHHMEMDFSESAFSGSACNLSSGLQYGMKRRIFN